MSKKIQATKLWQYFTGCSVLYKDHGNDRRNFYGTHDGVFISKADYAKLRKAWKLAEKMAALDLSNPDGLDPRQHWVDEARRIVGRK